MGHRPFDERIFQKISVSLAGAGFDVVYLVPFEGSEYREQGVAVQPLSGSRAGRSGVLRAMIDSLRAVGRRRFDAIEVHDPILFLLVPLLRILGGRVILNVHEDYGWIAAERVNLPIVRTLTKWAVWLVQWCCGLIASGVITVDDHIASRFPGCRKVVIRNFPPKSVSEIPREGASTAPGVLEVVYVGNMSAARGLSTLVEAVDGLDDTPVRLNLLGSMDGQDWLASVRHPERFRTHGRLPWRQTLQLLGSFHVGALLFQPTLVLQNVSGWGNTKLFEYLGSGVPALISDFPLLRRLADQVGGIVCVDPTDPRAVADAIRTLAADRGSWLRLSTLGRAAVRERFNWEIEEAKLLRFYGSLLGPDAPETGV